MVDIGDEAKAETVAAMIEDEQMVFAGESPESAPDRLDEPHLRFCRPCVDETGDHWKVDADRESRNVADYLRGAGAKAIEDALPIITVDKAIDVFRRDPSLEETLLQMLRMRAVHAVAKRRSVLASGKPGLDDVANERRLIHSFG